MLEHKRGDTFRIPVSLTEDDGVTPVPMTGWRVRSQVRRGDILVANLKFEEDDLAQGKYELYAEKGTADWPVAVLVSDIEYINASGDTISTETFEIDVIEDITRD